MTKTKKKSTIETMYDIIKASGEPMTAEEVRVEMDKIGLSPASTTIYTLLKYGYISKYRKNGLTAYGATDKPAVFGVMKTAMSRERNISTAKIDKNLSEIEVNVNEISETVAMNNLNEEQSISHAAFNNLQISVALNMFSSMIEKHGVQHMMFVLLSMDKNR